MSPAKQTAPLVPYIRQSNTTAGSDSFEVQWEAIVAWAAANGYELYVTSFDEAKALGLIEPPSTSGNKGWRDRGLGKAIKLVTDGLGSGVIGYDQSRITRENVLGQAEIWTALDESKGLLVDVTGGGIVNRMTFVIKGEMNRQQWEAARDRSVISRSRAVAAGKYVGPTPAGYDRGADQHLVPNAHAATITAAFEARAGGASWKAVSAILEGVPTKTGATTWSLKAAEKLLRNDAYRGHVRSGDFVNANGVGQKALAGVPCQPTHEPLVSEAIWTAVQARREIRGSWSASTRQRALLAGVATCGSCGGKLTADWTTRGGTKFETYRCKNRTGCPAPVSIGRDLLDRRAIEYLRDETGNPMKRVGQRQEIDLVPFQVALDSAQAELDAYLGMMSATDDGFKAGYDARVTRKQQALAALEEAQATAAPASGGWDVTLMEILQDMEDQDPNAVNAVMKATFAKVEVAALDRQENGKVAKGQHGGVGRVTLELRDVLPEL